MVANRIEHDRRVANGDHRSAGGKAEQDQPNPPRRVRNRSQDQREGGRFEEICAIEAERRPMIRGHDHRDSAGNSEQDGRGGERTPPRDRRALPDRLDGKDRNSGEDCHLE